MSVRHRALAAAACEDGDSSSSPIAPAPAAVLCGWSRLPDALVQEILSFCDWRRVTTRADRNRHKAGALISIARCSRRLALLATSSHVWRSQACLVARFDETAKLPVQHDAGVPTTRPMRLLRACPVCIGSFPCDGYREWEPRLVQSMCEWVRRTEARVVEADLAFWRHVPPAVLAAAPFKHIRRLRILQPRLDDPAAVDGVELLRAIVALRNLETLELIGNSSSGWPTLMPMEILRESASLTTLLYSDVFRADDGTARAPADPCVSNSLLALGGVPNLTQLNVNSPHLLGGLFKETFSQTMFQTQLRHLSLSHFDVLWSHPVTKKVTTNADLESTFAGMRALQTLRLHYVTHVDVLLSALHCSPSLSSLTISFWSALELGPAMDRPDPHTLEMLLTRAEHIRALTCIYPQGRPDASFTAAIDEIRARFSKVRFTTMRQKR